MLQITPEMLTYLRTFQRLAEAKERAKIERRAEVRKRTRRMNDEVRARMSAAVARILRAGDPTMFEYEASCRHGLRRTFIVNESWGWADADAEAAEIVAAALLLIGAERPTWEEGQLDFAALNRHERHFCARCGTIIADERRHNGTPAKYCSALCGTAARQDKARRSDDRTSRADWLASKAQKSARTIEERSGPCETCGTHVITARAGRRFCSLRCAHVGQTVRAEKPCQQCGQTFRPRLKGGKESAFCSNVCRGASLAKPIEPRDCRQCGTSFTPAYHSAKDQPFCSVACNAASRKKPRPEATCPTCRTVFRWSQASKPQTYCSAPCNPRSPTFVGRSAFTCEETR